MKVNHVHDVFFFKLLHLLKEAGVSPEQLFAELGRRGVVASPYSQRVSWGAEGMVLLEVAVDLTGDPCLMIRLGQQLAISNVGSFGFAMMSCANLRESVKLLLRYGRVLFQPSWKAYEQADGLLLRPRDRNGYRCTTAIAC